MDMRDFTTVRPDYLQHWIETAKPGWELCYHHGHLAYDREGTNPKTGARRFYEPMHTTGTLAYDAYEHGEVELYQRRAGPGTCHYFMRKRKT